MIIKIIKEKISSQELKGIAEETFGNMVKSAVDVEREILAVGGELHSDAEAILIEDGSKGNNVWGVNIYLNKPKKERIEFSALINIKPLSGNLSMEIQSPEIIKKITKIVDRLIQ